MNRPLISVIIPAYNGAAFLAEAIESIHQQNYDPLEIIIVDDGSTDDTPQIAASFQNDVRYIHQIHHGRPAAGRNRGVRESAGGIIGFLDQDDLWPANKLALQIPHLLGESSLDVILGHTQMLHLSNHVDGKRTFAAMSEPVDYMLLSSALFKKSVFDKVGFFDESLAYFGDDLDWFIRAREKGVSVHQLEDVTLLWRIHETNTSHNPVIRDHAQGYDRALTEVIKKSLDRRRNRKGNS